MKPLREYPARPADFGIICQEVTFYSADGLALRGWLYPPQDTVGLMNDLIGRVPAVPESLRPQPREYVFSGQPAPAIIICDGDAGNMSSSIFYAYHYFTRGYTVLAFDWRGFGLSQDWPIEPDQLCCPEFLIDYAAAIDFVKQRPEVDPNRIGLLGFSTGAYLSFAMAASRRDIAAFAGRGLITTLQELAENLKQADPARRFCVPSGYPPQLEPLNAASHMSVPALLIVGEKDLRTPPGMSRKVLGRLKGPRELWVVPGAEHGGPRGPEMIGYPEFFERTRDFFDEHLR